MKEEQVIRRRPSGVKVREAAQEILAGAAGPTGDGKKGEQGGKQQKGRAN